MKGSLERPVYSVYAIDQEGHKFNVKNAILALSYSHGEKDLAVKVNLTLMNAKIEDMNKKLNDALSLKDDIYIYADIGDGAKEVFRGIIWTKEYDEYETKEISIVAYDHLIYLQNSKDSFYFSAGKSTKDVLSSICKKWGVSLNYKYDSISHPKLLLRSQNISDSIIEVLDAVKKQTGKKYVIYSSKNVLYVDFVAQNKIVYTIKKKENAGGVKAHETMDGMVTKVVITGSADDDGKEPVLATVSGNTSGYGTLQDEISKDKDTTLSEAKKEANEVLKEKGKPFKDKTVEGIDNPMVKKGDEVKIDAGPLNAKYKVLSIEHDAFNRSMIVEVE